jgi:hypothetical protein
MSKIEICSVHPGATVKVTTKQGRKVNVEFEEKQGPNGPIGYAEVDEDVAARLLPLKKEYWKPGEGGPVPLSEVAINQALAADPVARAAAEKLLGGRSPEEVLAENEALKQKLADLEGGEKKASPIEKAQAARAAKKQLKEAIEAIKLAETAEEIDAIAAELPESEELATAVSERKAELAS